MAESIQCMKYEGETLEMDEIWWRVKSISDEDTITLVESIYYTLCCCRNFYQK